LLQKRFVLLWQWAYFTDEPDAAASSAPTLIGGLHDPANVQQTSSKCIQNTRESLGICWTFAGSCKHPI